MWANGARHSDGDGRYELDSLPEGAEVQLQVYNVDGPDGSTASFLQQCAAPPVVANGRTHVDAQLVSRVYVSASTDAVPAQAPGFRLISGVIYELTADGRRPAPDAFVDYEPMDDFIAAATRTDAAGRFLLCGIPDSRTVTIGAWIEPSRFAYQRVPPGAAAHIELEIR